MQGQYSSKTSPQEKTSSTMPTTSPKSSFTRLLLRPKPRPFKVLVLGQAEVGKSALVVRFITRRFIGEYDSSQEKTYTFQCEIDNEIVHFEILDSLSSCHQKGNLESNISWADAFILMYSVTDKCSFDECHRLKFLINYNKRRRRFAASMREPIETPVVMVGNKSDQVRDRMVSTEAGRQRSKDIGCVCFHEISVRENIEQVKSVFRDTRRFWRVSNKWSRRDREPHPNALGRPISRSSADSSPEPVVPARTSSRRWTTKGADEAETSSSSYVGRSDSTSSSGQSECGEPFRARASTDSRLPPHPTRARHPVTAPFPVQARRMSVSTKGNNTGTY